MTKVIGWIFELLFPSRSKHRTQSTPAPVPPVNRPVRPFAPLNGEEIALVRPYLIAHERRTEAAQQKQRRRAMVLATLGQDMSGVTL